MRKTLRMTTVCFRHVERLSLSSHPEGYGPKDPVKSRCCEVKCDWIPHYVRNDEDAMLIAIRRRGRSNEDLSILLERFSFFDSILSILFRVGLLNVYRCILRSILVYQLRTAG